MHQAAQPEGNGEIREQQRQRGGQKPGHELGFATAAVEAELHTRRQVGDRFQRRLAGDEIEGPPAAVPAVVPGWMARADATLLQGVAVKRQHCCRRRVQLPEAVQRFQRRQCLVALALCGHALAQGHQTAKHVDEQTGQRQVRPIVVGRGVDQHDPTLAAARRGYQRRAVDQPRPSLVGQIQAWLGQHLPHDLDVLVHGQAGERAVRRERRQARRAIPGHDAAHDASAAAERNGQQGIAARLGEARSGEPQQEPALFDPAGEFLRPENVDRPRVDLNDHRELALEQRLDRPFAQLGVGGERALQVVELAQ